MSERAQSPAPDSRQRRAARRAKRSDAVNPAAIAAHRLTRSDVIDLQAAAGNRVTAARLQGRLLQRRTEKRMRVSGVTHLVEMLDRSLLRGKQADTLRSGNRVTIDVDDRWRSRRGIGAEQDKAQYEEGRHKFVWSRALAVEGDDKEGQGRLYVRDEMLKPAPDPAEELSRTLAKVIDVNVDTTEFSTIVQAIEDLPSRQDEARIRFRNFLVLAKNAAAITKVFEWWVGAARGSVEAFDNALAFSLGAIQIIDQGEHQSFTADGGKLTAKLEQGVETLRGVVTGGYQPGTIAAYLFAHDKSYIQSINGASEMVVAALQEQAVGADPVEEWLKSGTNNGIYGPLGGTKTVGDHLRTNLALHRDQSNDTDWGPDSGEFKQLCDRLMTKIAEKIGSLSKAEIVQQFQQSRGHLEQIFPPTWVDQMVTKAKWGFPYEE